MSAQSTTMPAGQTHRSIQRRVDELGAWFQNIDLGGVQTAPAHFLGDYPGGEVARTLRMPSRRI